MAEPLRGFSCPCLAKKGCHQDTAPILLALLSGFVSRADLVSVKVDPCREQVG